MGEMRVQLCFLDFVHTSKYFYHFGLHSLIKYECLIYFFNIYIEFQILVFWVTIASW